MADPMGFQVIIDTMNVLLKKTPWNNDTVRQIVVSHAGKTMMDHVRADFPPPRNVVPLYGLPS